MSSIDGTTPQSYDQELTEYYNPDRSGTMRVFEQEALRLLEQRMQDLQDLAHNDPSSDLIFELVGEARKCLSEIEENHRKKLEAEEKKKLKAQAMPSPKPKVKPKAKPRPRKTTATKEPEVEASAK